MFYKDQKLKQSNNSKNRLKLISNATKSELILKLKLDKLKYKYLFQKGFWKGDFSCIVDFYLPKPYKICIEVDGNIHLNNTQKYRDNFKNDYLINKRRFKVLRITNEQAETISLKELKDLIESI